jgi:hypothetical protein
MPEETAPIAPVAPAESGAPSSVLKSLGCGCAALVALVALVVIVPLAGAAWSSWGSTDFERVAPEEMGDRAFRRSQEAYDVLGFKRAVQPGVEDHGVSTENTFSSSYCYDGGPLGMEDKTVDGAYAMSHRWALDHVPARQAESGMRRLHQHLKDHGWKITSYREGGMGKDWDLFVQRDDGDERMSFSWYQDRGYFTGGASVPCAYDPAWKTGDSSLPGDDQRPPVFGPPQ